jgi:hypothetical protein
VRRELAGLGLVLTGTGTESALGWSVTQEVGAALVLTMLAVSSVLGVVGKLWGIDGRGQKSEDNPRFPAPYKHYGFYTT